jgi:serine phosphatase RsbU (regulator of sigma subunit)
MTRLSAILRSLLSPDLPIPDWMTRANRLPCESTIASHYATLLCCRLAGDGSGEFAQAGHCRPIAVRARPTEPIDSAGPALGLFPRAVYAAIPFYLQTGDCLSLNTDGLTEARNEAGEEFGEQRLLETIASLRPARSELNVESLVNAVTGAVTRFRPTVPLSDDLTVIALRRTA